MRVINAVFGITAIALMGACTSTTVINTEPQGTKVYADGQLLGTAPVTYSDTKIVGAVTNITLKKPGCKDANYVLTRSEKFEVGPCIGGVFVLVPFLWVMGYNPQRTYEMDCTKSSAKLDNPLQLKQ